MGQRMRRFQRRDDAFEPRAELEGVERLVVGDRDILDALLLVEPGMLGADAGIVEPGRDRMRVDDLAVRGPAADRSCCRAARRARRR